MNIQTMNFYSRMCKIDACLVQVTNLFRGSLIEILTLVCIVKLLNWPQIQPRVTLSSELKMVPLSL